MSITKDELSKIMKGCWAEELHPLFLDKRMYQVQELLGSMIANNETFYPERENIFRVFKDLSIDDVKVLIIGQDPYIKRGEAIGRAFAVPADKPLPPSLKIIFKELQREYDLTDINDIDRTLDHWSQQGVMLLNAALTVKAGASSSHLKHWLWFTEEVVKILLKWSERTNDPLIVLCWGNFANKLFARAHSSLTYAHRFNPDRPGRPANPVHVLYACHPQAENYPGPHKFVGCRHFSSANRFLDVNGVETIKWY